MKKRIYRKQLKRNLQKVLNQLNYKITKQKFYYPSNFIVCDFSLKEIPNWNFGIIYYKNNKYKIYGEAKCMKDRFCYNNCVLSVNDYIDFEIELQKILNNDKKWNDYNQKVKEKEFIIKKEEQLNREIYLNIKNYINKYNKLFDEYKRDLCLKIHDANTKQFKVFPRYTISFYTDIEGFFTNEKNKKYIEYEENRVFEDLSKFIIEDNNLYIELDTYLLENKVLK